MIYTVTKIEEDLDYGCEERGENTPVMAVVTLTSPDGGIRQCKMPGQLLYDRDISRGDKVIFDEEQFLRKPLGKNWTETCGGKKSGGNVGVLSRDSQKTIIGCDSCDMRITLDIQ